MAVTIVGLARGTLLTSPSDLYPVPIGKAAIVSSIRLVNTGGATATVNLYVRRGGSGTLYRIAPMNMTLPAGYSYVDEAELTLEAKDTGNQDRIQGSVSSGGTVDYVISGVERDQA
jgi:hypothetical protein